MGSKLFTAEGPRAVKKLADLGCQIFLDLKFHDIPSTVAGAVAAAADLPSVRLLTLHASGGMAMMCAAREAVEGRMRRPALLGVTVLTSMDARALRETGMSSSPAIHVAELARLAKKARLDGVVASGHEIRAIRRSCGPKFQILVPSVRLAGASANDQARVVTPTEATRAGANFLVVGRPITAAKNPRSAALAILEEICSASK